MPVRSDRDEDHGEARRRHSISNVAPGSHEESTSPFARGLAPDLSAGAASSTSSLTEKLSADGKKESKVLAFKQKVFTKRQSNGCSYALDRSLLEGDPWDGCDDIAEEDLVDWFLDFFARRDAARRGTPERVVARAVSSDQPAASKRRLRKLVLEPVALLAEDAGAARPPEARPSGQASCKEGAGTGQSDRDLSGVREHLSGISTASCCSRGGNAAGGSVPSTPGRSTGNTAATPDVAHPALERAGPVVVDKDLQFAALCTVEEVWLRLSQVSVQALVNMLNETRRHLVKAQVKKMRDSATGATGGLAKSSSSSILAGGLETAVLEGL